MKKCPQCKKQFPEHLEKCTHDNSVLIDQPKVPSEIERETVDAIDTGEFEGFPPIYERKFIKILLTGAFWCLLLTAFILLWWLNNNETKEPVPQNHQPPEISKTSPGTIDALGLKNQGENGYTETKRITTPANEKKEEKKPEIRILTGSANGE